MWKLSWRAVVLYQSRLGVSIEEGGQVDFVHNGEGVVGILSLLKDVVGEPWRTLTMPGEREPHKNSLFC